MYNKLNEGLIGDNADFDWKAYVQTVASVYTYRRVDNTMDDTTEINLANKCARALVKDMCEHKQLDKAELYGKINTTKENDNYDYYD